MSNKNNSVKTKNCLIFDSHKLSYHIDELILGRPERG